MSIELEPVPGVRTSTVRPDTLTYWANQKFREFQAQSKRNGHSDPIKSGLRIFLKKYGTPDDLLFFAFYRGDRDVGGVWSNPEEMRALLTADGKLGPMLDSASKILAAYQRPRKNVVPFWIWATGGVVLVGGAIWYFGRK